MNGMIPGKPKNTAAEVVAGRHIPDHWQGSILSNDFRANRTVRYELQPEGSGYSAKEVETVLHSSHRSFRPVDIKMGPDGAIYVVDWYNAIIDHGEVDFYHPQRDKSHGRIWRLTATDRPLVEPPAIADEPVTELLDLLKAPEPYTRNQVRRELAARPLDEVSKALDKWLKTLDSNDPEHERHRLEALWVLMSHRAAPADLLDAALQSKSPLARAAAARAIANTDTHVKATHKADPIALLARAVEDEHPQVRLEAVNGLRELGTLAAADIGLRARAHATDDNLNYALELTVRQLRDEWLPAMQAGKRVFDGDPGRLAYALEQVGDPRAVSRLLELVTSGSVGKETLPQALATIAAMGTPDDLESVLAMAKRKPKLLAAVAQGAADNGNRPPSAQDILGFLNSDDDDGALLAATELTGIWRIDAARPRLVTIANARRDRDGPLLEAACRALARLEAREELKQLSTVGPSSLLRARAIAAWARTAPDVASRLAVRLWSETDDLTLTALTVDAILGHDRGRAALVAALDGVSLSKPKALAALRRVQASGREMPALVTALQRAARLEPLSQTLTADERRGILADVAKTGDASRGRKIYDREALRCTSCHVVAGRGTSVGPDLTTVGTYATPESLLESLIQPSTTIKQGYETVVVVKNDGTVVAGLLERKTGTATLVRDADGNVVAIRTADIVSIDPSPVSLMPTGLTASLRRDELVDLLRYLTALGKAHAVAQCSPAFVHRVTPAASRLLPALSDGCRFSTTLRLSAASS